MSFWVKSGIKINDLEVFKSQCQKWQVSYEINQDANFKWQGFPVHATLTDQVDIHGYQRNGFLVREGGGYKLMVDNDPKYSTLTARLGANGGKMCRDYATEVFKNQVSNAGGFIDYSREMDDGSVVMKVSMV